MKHLMLGVLAVATLGAQPGWAATPAECDLNDSGRVTTADYHPINQRLGKQLGEVGYLEGVDLNRDQIINIADLQVVRACLRQVAPRSPTRVEGNVVDGVGNPLENVKVSVGTTGSPFDMTDNRGHYSIVVPIGSTGVSEINFDGSEAIDRTDSLSGEFPTIPHKPLFINGGVTNEFRLMSLPERDFHNAVDLTAEDLAECVEGTSTTTCTLNEGVHVDNAGVSLTIPAGCAVTVPNGPSPFISIARVNPSLLPVPMPPNLQSGLFITYQPGGSVIDCPAGVGVVTTFDNADGFDVGFGNLVDGPFLAGVSQGVFKALVACEVVDTDEDGQPADQDDEIVCEVPDPFEFAWYHVDIVPAVPCPRTTVVGQVKSGGVPVAGATVSASGMTPVSTDASGNFSIPNVAAGPNGPFCASSPFNVRAAATTDSPPDFGLSMWKPAVSGGITDVGMIELLDDGDISGQALKLWSLAPFIVTPVEGADISLSFGGGSGANQTDTDANGNYAFDNVPVGFFSIFLNFVDAMDNFFFGSDFSEIRFPGDVATVDFRLVDTGTVRVTVRDQNGGPVAFPQVNLQSQGGDLGAGFQSPGAFCFGFGHVDGIVLFEGCNNEGLTRTGGTATGNLFAALPRATLDGEAAGAIGGSGIPLGDCEITEVFVGEGAFVPIVSQTACRLNEGGQQIEVTVVVNTENIGAVEGDISDVLVDHTVDGSLFRISYPAGIIGVASGPTAEVVIELSTNFAGAADNRNSLINERLVQELCPFGECDASNVEHRSDLVLIDRTIICEVRYDFDEFEQEIDVAECRVEDADGNVVADNSGTGTPIGGITSVVNEEPGVEVLEIVVDDEGRGPITEATISVLSRTLADGCGNTNDRAPNSGSIALSGSLLDAIGDTFVGYPGGCPE